MLILKTYFLGLIRIPILQEYSFNQYVKNCAEEAAVFHHEKQQPCF